MGIRIWHQSFTTLSDLPLYRDGLKRRIGEIVRPDTEVALHGQLPGTYASNYPGTDLSHGALFYLHGMQWIACAREAERQGFDALVCATMSNPLLNELRSIVEIPVIGYGEVSMHTSAMFGRRFGMLCFIAGRLELWAENARQWGCGDRFVGARPAGVSFNDVLTAYGDLGAREGIIARIVAAGEDLVRTTGADVIVPSEMPLNLLLAMAGVSEIAGATVFDGLAMTYKVAELMCDMRRISAMRPSRRGFHHARPEPARVEEVLAFYGVDRLGAGMTES